MFHQNLKELFNEVVAGMAVNISDYVVNPGKDLSRTRKIPADLLMSFLVSQGSSGTKCEILDFFDFSADAPSASALNQQRSKLKPEALEALFSKFNAAFDASAHRGVSERYRFLAADGSTVSFFSHPRFSTDDYFVSDGHSAKGFYSMHINAFYDLTKKIYTGAVIQPVHAKDEFRAFCTIVDQHKTPSDVKHVYIGDRGYCSYNNMAHVLEQKQYFLFRTKDITSKGLVGQFEYPNSDTFDVNVNVTLVRSHSRKIQVKPDHYRRFVDAAASFDFIEYGSLDTYDLTFRVVRFSLSEGSYECIVTNLPSDEFPPERLKETYNNRWGIESSFRKLKYTIGLSNFHSYKPDYIKQEIWAKLLAYNLTELLVNHTVAETHDTKHSYIVNFTVAAHICRIYLRLTAEIDSIDVMSLLKKELTPIRNNRQFPRLKTAHFRRPKYFLYRAA